MGELLTIELVPQSSWYKNVRSHVAPEVWERIKKKIFGHAGYRCQVCGGKGTRWPVECHEIFEYTDATRVQRLIRFMALCPACHEVKHIGLASVRGRRREALRHLARVNNWSVADAEAYAEGCFEQWSRRSNHQWKLDLSYLEKFLRDDSDGRISK